MASSFRQDARILLYLLSFLIFSLPSRASIQCGPSEADPSIQIDSVAIADLPALKDSKEGQPVAGFRITGVRPKRIMRIGFHAWHNGQETPEPYRAGYSSECEPFESFVFVWVRENASGNSGELSIQYQYASGENALESQVVTLELSRAALPHFQTLAGSTTVPFEADLPIWGVFIGATPKPGESITETAARSDRAIVLHVKNSEY